MSVTSQLAILKIYRAYRPNIKIIRPENLNTNPYGYYLYGVIQTPKYDKAEEIEIFKAFEESVKRNPNVEGPVYAKMGSYKDIVKHRYAISVQSLLPPNVEKREVADFHVYHSLSYFFDAMRWDGRTQNFLNWET